MKSFFDKMVKAGVVERRRRLHEGLHAAVREQEGRPRPAAEVSVERRRQRLLPRRGRRWPGEAASDEGVAAPLDPGPCSTAGNSAQNAPLASSDPASPGHLLPPGGRSAVAPAALSGDVGRRSSRCAACRQVFANGTVALAPLDLDVRHGRVPVAARSLGLRQVDGAAHDRRARPSRRPAPSTWAGGARPEIGFVFQEPTLMPWASVFDNVWLPLRLRGVSQAPRPARASARRWRSSGSRTSPTPIRANCRAA